MIRTPKALDRLCHTILSYKPLEIQNVCISRQIYRLFTNQQYKEKHPNLVGWRERNSYYMMRVR